MRQREQRELGGHGQLSNQNYQNCGQVDHTQDLVEGTNHCHQERRDRHQQNRQCSSSAASQKILNFQQQNLQREQAEQLRARNALQRAEAHHNQREIELNEALECERQQAQAVRDIQAALAQQFRDEQREQQENFIRRSQELRQQAEDARLQQQQLGEHHLPLGCRSYVEPNERFSLGGMNVICPECGALHFESEKLTSSTNCLISLGCVAFKEK